MQAGSNPAAKNNNALQEPEVKYAAKPSMPIEQLKLKSSFSINEGSPFKNGSQAPNQPTAQEPGNKLPDKEVTVDEVKAAVLKYAEVKQSEGARQIATILTMASVVFENNKLTLTINNETQKEQLLLVRQHFIDELRLSLQNSGIQMDIAISELEVQAKAYKPVDIFKAMADKNPALLELKKRFDLEIDY